MSALIEFDEVCKYYQMGDTTVKAADHITMKIEKGEFVAIVGQSGSGKSTCMNIIGCLDVPTHGTYRLNGRDVGKMSRNELAAIRNEMLGFIFQQYNLLPRLNLMENVEVPLVYAGIGRTERHARAKEVLEQVGLGDKLKAYPAQLSGGQQQRVAIARALATHPRILLCDEATSALDPQSTQSILALIRDIHDKLGLTVIVITHQMSVVEQICTQVAILDNGAVAEVGPVSEVFASPSSQAAKRLVYPEGYDQPIASPGEHLIRIVFNGADSAKTPLIAHMAMHENIAASIVSASTRSIGGKTYGNMLLGIPGGAEELRRAMDYLGGTPDIIVEEVKPDEH